MRSRSVEGPIPTDFVFTGNERFAVEAAIGQGGMGRVYRVIDRDMGAPVALKSILRPTADHLYRLKREFRARVGLSHPNLVQLYDLFVEERACFFTMELLDGGPFMAWVRGPLSGPATSAEATASILDTGTSDPSSDAPTSSPETLTPPLPASARQPSGLDEEGTRRLRVGLTQLVTALDALHQAGQLHRDVKPSNVQVTSQGRVVLLDFGLALDVQEHLDNPTRREFAGTLSYMAPEQISGRAMSEATDFYAVGCMLYEALTGLAPYQGHSSEIALSKRTREPPHPRELVADAPADLAQLALDLLRSDPNRRPGPREILSRLSSSAGEELLSEGPSSRPPVHGSFVGRKTELQELEAEFERVASTGEPAVVHVSGSSGIGKSTLVSTSIRSLSGRAALVLRGRCHPQENIPYNALDAAVDALVRRLEDLDAPEVATLLPPAAYALSRIFPVFGRVRAFARAKPPAQPLSDEIDLRRAAFGALRAIFTRLAIDRPIVLWLDDVQWGDADSAELLAELLSPPSPPRVLVVLSYRSEGGSTGVFLSSLRERLGEAVRRTDMTLGPLSLGETDELVRRSLGGSGSALSSAISAQSSGDPFVVGEFVRFVTERAFRGDVSALPGPLDANRLLNDRITRLPEADRAILEVASLAAHPLDQDLTLQSSGLGPRDRPRLARLRDDSLLRQVANGGDRAGVAPYHDRIRDAVRASMPPERQTALHRAIAEAVAARAPEDFEVLLEHWKGAGEPLRAGEAAQGAADRAAAALAFERAAALYDEARGLLGAKADGAALLEKAGTAFANAGQAVLAAERLLAAADKLGAQADRTHIRALRRQAAEQYIKCGHLVDGWAVMRGLLEEMQISVPTSTRSALLAAMVQRFRFVLNPLKVEQLKPRPVSPQDAARLELLWVASTSLAMVNTALADEIRTRHLLSVFKHGDESAILQALAYEAAMETLLPGGFFAKRADKLLAKASYLAEKTQGPYDLAWTLLGKSISAFSRGQYRKAAELCEESDRVFRERCPGSAWIRATVAYFHYQALANSGQLKLLREKMTAQAAEAERRNDTFGLSECFTGDEALAWISVGKGAWARLRAEVELARQAPQVNRWPENCFRTQQYADVIAQVHTYLYDGDPWAAFKAILGRWGDLNGNFFLALRQVGSVCWYARGRAALAAAEHLAHGGQRPTDMDARWNVPTLMADVRRSAKALEKDAPCGGVGLAAALRAGALNVMGSNQEAIVQLRRAVAELEKTELTLHTAAARLVLSSLLQEAESSSLRQVALDWMTEEGVSDPLRLAGIFVIGLTRREPSLPGSVAQ